MATLLTIGWLSLIVVIAIKLILPRVTKDETMINGWKIILVSMYVGILWGMAIAEFIIH